MLFAWIPEDMETKTSALIILLKEIIPMEIGQWVLIPFWDLSQVQESYKAPTNITTKSQETEKGDELTYMHQ